MVFESLLAFWTCCPPAFCTHSNRGEILAWKLRYRSRYWAQRKHRPVRGWPQSRTVLFLTERGPLLPGLSQMRESSGLHPWWLFELFHFSHVFSLFPSACQEELLNFIPLGLKRERPVDAEESYTFPRLLFSRFLLEDDVWFPGCCWCERKTGSFSINSLKTSPFYSF